MRPSRLAPVAASLAALLAFQAAARAQEMESWAALRRTPMSAMPMLSPAALGARPDSLRRFGVVGAGGAGQLVVGSTGWMWGGQVTLATSGTDTMPRWRPQAFGIAWGRTLSRWVPWSDIASLSVGFVGGVGYQPDRAEDERIALLTYGSDGQPMPDHVRMSLRSGPFRSVTGALPIALAWHPQRRPDDPRAVAVRAYIAPVASAGWRGRHERPVVADDGTLVARQRAGREAGDLYLVYGARLDGPWGLGVDAAYRAAPATSGGFEGRSLSVSWTIPLP